MSFKIVGGDLPEDTRISNIFNEMKLSFRKKGTIFGTTTLKLNNNIHSLEQVTEDNKNSVLKKAGWGTVGALAFGPVGLLAGLFMGGTSKEVCFTCELKTGERFVATCDLKTYQKLYALTF